LIRYELPDGSVKTSSSFPGGTAEALAEDIIEIEGEEEVPEKREVVGETVTPDGEAAALPEDADMVIEEVVVAEVDSAELSSSSSLMVEIGSSPSS
jgi:hypothetical protein